MRKIRQFVLFALLLFAGIGLALPAIAGMEDRELFLEVLSNHNQASFQAKFIYQPKNGQYLPGAQPGTTITYSRFVAEDGFIFRKLEIPSANLTFVENRSGGFGVSDYLTAPISNISVIAMPDALCQMPTDLMLDHGSFSTNRSKFNGHPCREVSMRLPGKNEELFQEITGYPKPHPGDLPQSYDNYKAAMKNWVVQRSIKFDDETKLIFSRVHRNTINKKNFQLDFISIDPYVELSEADFAVSGATSKAIRNADEFIYDYNKARAAARDAFSFTRWFADAGRFIWMNFDAHLEYVSPVLAVLGIGVLLALRYFRKLGKI